MPGYEEQHGTIMADEAERDTRDASNGQTARKADDGQDGHDEQQILPDALEAQEKLAALLRDLDALHTYLTQRGRHTYDLAQAFLENARRNTESRAFDERQATMLEYQHYIWLEIAGQVNKLIVSYGGEAIAGDGEDGAKGDEGTGGEGGTS